jgi:hypothetical protein
MATEVAKKTIAPEHKPTGWMGESIRHMAKDDYEGAIKRMLEKADERAATVARNSSLDAIYDAVDNGDESGV